MTWYSYRRDVLEDGHVVDVQLVDEADWLAEQAKLKAAGEHPQSGTITRQVHYDDPPEGAVEFEHPDEAEALRRQEEERQAAEDAERRMAEAMRLVAEAEEREQYAHIEPEPEDEAEPE